MTARTAGGHGCDLADAGIYKHWDSHVIRFADIDAAGHVNNVAYAVLFESGRVSFWEAAGVPAAAAGATTVIVRMSIEYRAQMYFPGTVEVGTRALKIGRSSCTLGQGLFRDGECFATSEAVSVLVDRESGRSTPIPDAVRALTLARSGG